MRMASTFAPSIVEPITCTQPEHTSAIAIGGVSRSGFALLRKFSIVQVLSIIWEQTVKHVYNHLGAPPIDFARSI